MCDKAPILCLAHELGLAHSQTGTSIYLLIFKLFTGKKISESVPRGTYRHFAEAACSKLVARSSQLPRLESNVAHGGDGLRVLHEGVPDEGGAEIFGHEETNAEIDAEDVGVVPVQLGVEGVTESVAAPGVLTEVFAEGAEDADRLSGKKGEGSGCGRRGRPSRRLGP